MFDELDKRPEKHFPKYWIQTKELWIGGGKLFESKSHGYPCTISRRQNWLVCGLTQDGEEANYLLSCGQLIHGSLPLPQADQTPSPRVSPTHARASSLPSVPHRNPMRLAFFLPQRLQLSPRAHAKDQFLDSPSITPGTPVAVVFYCGTKNLHAF